MSLLFDPGGVSLAATVGPVTIQRQGIDQGLVGGEHDLGVQTGMLGKSTLDKVKEYTYVCMLFSAVIKI